MFHKKNINKKKIPHTPINQKKKKNHTPCLIKKRPHASIKNNSYLTFYKKKTTPITSKN